jgi:hypothetical protein
MKDLIAQVGNSLTNAGMQLEQIQQHLDTLTPEERNKIGQEMAEHKDIFLNVVAFSYLIPTIQPWDLNILGKDEHL